IRKLNLYSAAGVREYWIVDPEKETIVVYDLEHDEAPAFYHFGECISSRIIPGLKLDLREMQEYIEL
ncbi:MAG: Uma2 family endonuclease, partial [Roseburia sp.]|nr:Uma2 family endonuclease [Roseburia sp.]